MKKWLILMAVMALSLVAMTQSAAAYPAPKKDGLGNDMLVNDFAGVFSADQEHLLNNRLRAHEAKTSQEVAVVVLRKLEGQDIKEYSEGLFQAWGIGKEEKDNGVLILIATDEPGKNGGKGRRRIEVGYGLEGQLTDGIGGEILRANRPAFDEGRIAESIEGLVAGVLKVITPVEAAPPPQLSPEEKQRRKEAREAEYAAKLAAQKRDAEETERAKEIFVVILIAVFAAVVLGFGGYFAYHLGGEYLQKRRERRENQAKLSELVALVKEELDRLRNLPDLTIGKFDRGPEWIQAGAKRLAEKLRQQISESEETFQKVINGEWRRTDGLDSNLMLMRHAYAVICAGKETVDEIVGWPDEVVAIGESASKASAKAREEMARLKTAIESVKGQGFRIDGFNDDDLARAELALTKFDDELKSGLDPRAVQQNIEKVEGEIRLQAGIVLDLPLRMKANSENARRQREMLDALEADRPAVEVVFTALYKSNPLSAIADLDRIDDRTERLKAVAELLEEAESDNTLEKQNFSAAKTKIEAAGRELSKLKTGFAQIREREREILEAKSGFQKKVERAAGKIREAWSSVQSPDVSDSLYHDRLKGAEGNLAKAKAAAGATGNIDWLAMVGLILAAETAALGVRKEAEADIARAVAARLRAEEERLRRIQEDEDRRRREQEDRDRRAREARDRADRSRRSSNSGSGGGFKFGGGKSGGGGADD